MPKFYGYIMAAELAENPYTEPPAATTANLYLYLNEDTVGEKITASRVGNIPRERFDSEFKVLYNTAAAHTAIKNEDILTWYKKCQL